MYLYQHNKNVPGFTYLTCVFSATQWTFLLKLRWKRAVRYVKRCHTESAQRYVFLWDQVVYKLAIAREKIWIVSLYHAILRKEAWEKSHNYLFYFLFSAEMDFLSVYIGRVLKHWKMLQIACDLYVLAVSVNIIFWNALYLDKPR